MEITRKEVLIKVMFFAVFVAICHFVFLKFYLYWTDSWVDIPMHIFGGILVSSIGLWILYFSGLKNYLIKNPKSSIFISVLIAIIVGILWEIFELYFGLISHSFFDRVDSVKDLLDDVIGGLIAGWYFVRNIKKIWLD